MKSGSNRNKTEKLLLWFTELFFGYKSEVEKKYRFNPDNPATQCNELARAIRELALTNKE